MLRVRLRNSELDELDRRFSELATKAAGVKIGKPDSPTGKLFIENMRTSNNMEQLRSRIEDAQRGEEEALRSMAEQRDAERRMDVQGNPLDANGSLKVDTVNSINDITDDDFEAPERNIQLPAIPKNVDDAIGANGKPVVIKKSIFNKNKNSHRDLTSEDGRRILQETFFNTDLYGQNKKRTRPYNWILIHLADKNSSVIVEVNENKDNVEVVNWHYLGNEELERKKRQAIKEGGLILTLSDDNVAANTRDRLSSTAKDTESFSDTQEDLFDKIYDEAGSLEDSWNDRILDYIYEHYPTQATVSAETKSPKGMAEREAMRNDEELKRMKEQAKAEIDASLKKADAAFNKAMETGSPLFRDVENYTPEEQEIIDRAKENGSYMKAPNGNPSNLNEKQWAQVRTKAFKDWFGDWENDPENASKVVDENGEPRVVYHRSQSKFFVFDTGKIGSSTGTSDGRGFYFTTDRNYAEGYGNAEGQVLDAFLNIRKPLSLERKTITKKQLIDIIRRIDEEEFSADGEYWFVSNYGNYYDNGVNNVIREAADAEYGYAENDVELVNSMISSSGNFDLVMRSVTKVTGKGSEIYPKKTELYTMS